MFLAALHMEDEEDRCSVRTSSTINPSSFVNIQSALRPISCLPSFVRLVMLLATRFSHFTWAFFVFMSVSLTASPHLVGWPGESRNRSTCINPSAHHNLAHLSMAKRFDDVMAFEYANALPFLQMQRQHLVKHSVKPPIGSPFTDALLCSQAVRFSFKVTKCY